MNREDIIRIAREAGMNVVDDQYSLLPFLERFFQAAYAAGAAAEREECAKVCENFQRDSIYTSDLAGHVAAFKNKLAETIRARSKK